MKTKSKAAVKQVRTRYSPQFKEQALARAAQAGVAVAAKDLGLQEKQTGVRVDFLRLDASG